MRNQLLEARVMEIVERVRRGSAVEDDLVELKWELPQDVHKAARQIGGSANAAGGAPVLWIVGLDEKDGSINASVCEEDAAKWWPAVQRWFGDGVSPGLADFRRVVVAQAEWVTVLQFSTEDAPYLVKTASGGQVEAEVPWREGTSTRTARRHQLLRSVTARAALPEFEPIGGDVFLVASNESGRSSEAEYVRGPTVNLNVEVFVSVDSSWGPSVLPRHRQEWLLTVGGRDQPVVLKGALVRAGTRTVREQGGGRLIMKHFPAGYIDVADGSTMVINGSARVNVTAHAEVSTEVERAFKDASQVHLRAVLPADRQDHATVLTATFQALTPSERDALRGADTAKTAIFRFVDANARGCTE